MAAFPESRGRDRQGDRETDEAGQGRDGDRPAGREGGSEGRHSLGTDRQRDPGESQKEGKKARERLREGKKDRDLGRGGAEKG